MQTGQVVIGDYPARGASGALQNAVFRRKVDVVAAVADGRQTLGAVKGQLVAGAAGHTGGGRVRGGGGVRVGLAMVNISQTRFTVGGKGPAERASGALQRLLGGVIKPALCDLLANSAEGSIALGAAAARVVAGLVS